MGIGDWGLFGRLEPKEKLDEDDNVGFSLIEIFTKEYIGNDSCNIIYEFIDKKENETLQHVLLYLFEYKIEKYFFKLKDKYYQKDKNKYLQIIFNLSGFIYFKKATLTFIQINENNFKEEGYNNLLKLYAIVYIKRYIEHYINLKLEETIENDGIKNDKD